ncbi:MAG: hypothetical protein HZB66_03540 [Candidatus Aenigmarchaeota archaeon]|nr:hypothetical protein [Candidatus Aenigmarchaeota archaeon]
MKRGELVSVDQTIEKAIELSRVNVVSGNESAAYGYYAGKRVFLRGIEPGSVPGRLPAVGIGNFVNTIAIVMLPQSNQELLDMIIQSYRVCEDKKVLLPAIIVRPWDMREEVLVPTKESIDKFLPPVKSKLDKTVYGLEKNSENQLLEAKKQLEKTAETWYQKFHRSIRPVEADVEGSEYVFICSGRNAGTVSKVAKELRAQGEKVGTISVRIIRPWFGNEIKNLVKNAKTAVIDSFPSRILHAELCIGSSYVSERISEQAVRDIFKQMKEAG